MSWSYEWEFEGLDWCLSRGSCRLGARRALGTSSREVRNYPPIYGFWDYEEQDCFNAFVCFRCLCLMKSVGSLDRLFSWYLSCLSCWAGDIIFFFVCWGNSYIPTALALAFLGRAWNGASLCFHFGGGYGSWVLGLWFQFFQLGLFFRRVGFTIYLDWTFELG